MDNRLATVLSLLADMEDEDGNDIYASELRQIDTTDTPESIADALYNIYN